MRKETVLFLSVAIAGFVAAGCEARVVHPTFKASDFRTSEARMPTTILLYLPKSFMDFTPAATEVMVFRKWNFYVAASTASAFRHALKARFDRVEVRYEEPEFPLQTDNTSEPPLADVKPAFREFKSRQPYMIRFEGYRVRLTVEVQLISREGSEIFSRSYTGHDAERFLSVLRDDIGAFAFREASRVAIKEVVEQATEDIVAALRR